MLENVIGIIIFLIGNCSPGEQCTYYYYVRSFYIFCYFSKSVLIKGAIQRV